MPTTPVVLAANNKKKSQQPVMFVRPEPVSTTIRLPPLTHETVRTTCLVVLTLVALMLLFETKQLVSLLRRRLR